MLVARWTMTLCLRRRFGSLARNGIHTMLTLRNALRSVTDRYPIRGVTQAGQTNERMPLSLSARGAGSCDEQRRHVYNVDGLY